MALSQESVQTLQAAIAEGTFPDSEDFLRADLDVSSIPSLLTAISRAKETLSSEIQDISSEKAQDVDTWVLQAKKVQDDIARCKSEARQIVEEHERVQAIRNSVKDASEKVHLLETEISFNQSVQHELESIAEIAQVLDEGHRDLIAKQPVLCVQRLISTKTPIQRVPTGPSRLLLEQIEGDLRRKSRSQLSEALEETWIAARTDDGKATIEVVTDSSALDKTQYNIFVQDNLDSLAQLDSLPHGADLILTKLQRLLLPLFSRKLGLHPSAVQVIKNKLVLELASTPPDISMLIGTVREILTFLHSIIPDSIRDQIAGAIVPRLISSLTTDWLNPAVPHDLSELGLLHTLRTDVQNLESLLSSYGWPATEELRDWSDQIPRTWLNKRRMTSLDAVRTALSSANGVTRPVERVERQIIQKEEPTNTVEGEDWNAAWDDEPTVGKSTAINATEDENEAEGWDFDTEEDTPTPKSPAPVSKDEEEDDGEAWGWGDDDDAPVEKVNGQKPSASAQATEPEEEVVLTEVYYVTDIVDHILEVIGRDISDSQTLKFSHDEYFSNSSAPTSALQALPTVVLAMYRAMAPVHYSHSRNLSNMNLYNDTLYITQKVTETATTDTKSTLQPALDAMSKFARQTYSKELDLQRTILSDLLDGAQGFVSCDSDQYRDLSANAISSVVDRIRQVHQEYQNTLGQSHLLQTTGSLISTILGKIIADIEDLEDISEKQSSRLVQYCQEISSLGDLFMATKPTPSTEGSAPTEDVEKVSTIALYVPNYFRFQYLTEILEGSLADIKFMWTEGGLKADFSAEEVIDLIRALFAESNHRRSAISAIRASG